VLEAPPNNFFRSLLRTAVKGGLIFRNISNADERMKSITQMVEGALRQIDARLEAAYAA
jgi:hypothetical protein